MIDPVLSVRNLKTKFQIGSSSYNVVDSLSFDLHQGKTLAVVGESGCGKTLMALSLMRILPTPPALPSEGEVIYRGKNLLAISEKEMRSIRGSRMAMIFQDPSSALNPVYTIGDQLLEVAALHLHIYGDEAFVKCVKTLSEVGISAPKECMFAYPHQLSGGMKQRAMIAMALLCEPDILIADEPTTALDVTIQAQVLDLIRELQKRMGLSVLLITHDMGVVAEMADDVIVMYASQAVERGNVFQIFDQMAHPYTLGLFQSLPTMNTGRGNLKPIKGYVPPVTNYPKGCRFHPRCPFIMNKCHHGEVPNFIIQETAVQGDKVMQGFKSESFVMMGDHSQMVKAPTITNDSGLKDCVNLSPSTAVSRIIDNNKCHLSRCWLHDKTEESKRRKLEPDL